MSSALTQQRLPLGDGEPADSALLSAFKDSGLPLLGYTYQRAIRIPHIRLALIRTAEAALRARQERCA